MSKVKTALIEPQIDQRLVDERGPTAERMHGTEFDVGDSGLIRVCQSPIERGWKRGEFTYQHYVAAEKLYGCWMRAGLAGSFGSSDPLKIFATPLDFTRLFATEAAEADAWIVRKAFKAIADGAEGFGQRASHACKVLQLVVCEERTFLEAGRAIGFKGTKAETMATTLVHSALNILVKKWGL